MVVNYRVTGFYGYPLTIAGAISSLTSIFPRSLLVEGSTIKKDAYNFTNLFPFKNISIQRIVH